MRTVAILIPGSPNPAFYSQIAVISLALRKLNWVNWKPTIHAYFGADQGDATDVDWQRWRPHLRDIETIKVSDARFAEMENWAQVDATIRLAPRDADVLISLDADTLPVQNFEPVLERVAQENLVAGVIAHYPVPPPDTPQENWIGWAKGLLDRPLAFDYTHSLVGQDEPEVRRAAPFYVNGGVVFYARKAFDAFAPRYLDFRQRLMDQMEDNNFSGQVAFTLAVEQEQLATLALPMRYNFPNDAIAERMYPAELENAVIYHYLRTNDFDRHQIFASKENYSAFLARPLMGVNLQFREAVRRMLGERYPFD